MTRISHVFSIALLLASAACSQAGAPAADAVARGADQARAAAASAVAKPRIVFLGDSLTAGYGMDKEQAVPALVQERLRAEGYDYEVVNAGVSGDTSAAGLSRLDWALEGPVKVLFIELGANDGLRGLPVDQLKRNLETIIERAKARGITVILSGMEAPPNYGPLYTAQFRQVYRELADDHDVVFMPFYLEGVAGVPSLNLSDGIHPNAAGARVIERMVWQTLEPVLEKQTR